MVEVETGKGNLKISANRRKKFTANTSETKSVPCKYNASTSEANATLIQCKHIK